MENNRVPYPRLLFVLACLASFYFAVGYAILNPNIDEDYRRTYVTQEFGVYPSSPIFDGVNPLLYKLGSMHRFDTQEGQRLLSRFDWLTWKDRSPFLKGLDGRVFIKLENNTTKAALFKLTLGIKCAFQWRRNKLISFNFSSIRVGDGVCDQGENEFVFIVPADILRWNDYNEIDISRRNIDFPERVRTRLGLRSRAVEIMYFKIEPLLSS